jgi:hypothetical protein
MRLAQICGIVGLGLSVIAVGGDLIEQVQAHRGLHLGPVDFLPFILGLVVWETCRKKPSQGPPAGLEEGAATRAQTAKDAKGKI